MNIDYERCYGYWSMGNLKKGDICAFRSNEGRAPTILEYLSRNRNQRTYRFKLMVAGDDLFEGYFKTMMMYPSMNFYDRQNGVETRQCVTIREDSIPVAEISEVYLSSGQGSYLYPVLSESAQLLGTTQYDI